VALDQTCTICGTPSGEIFSSKIIKKYIIKYFLCPNCGFLQTEKPFWLKEAYECPINIYDTGILSRNINLSKKTSVLLYLLFNPKERYLDYAGGYGIFTRLMRDIGYNFLWYDPYTQNLLARGFEYRQDQKIELVTSFETFEHFPEPLVEIEKMLSISRNILFTTILLPENIPEPDSWWYYGREHGQHISFYSVKTLTYIARKYGLNLCTNHYDIHLLSDKLVDNNIFNKIVHSYNQIHCKDLISLWEYRGGFVRKDIRNIFKIKRMGLFEFLRTRLLALTSQDMEYLKSIRK